jgi:hypothetical protein
VVEGELAETEFLYVLEEIRRCLGSAGQVSQLGRSFTWSMGKTPTNRNVEVSVSVRAGRTRIMINETLGNLVGAVYGPIGGGMGGGGSGMMVAIIEGALHMPALLIGAIPLWLLATYGTARAVYSGTSKRRRRELGDLADRLAAVIEDEIAQGVPKLPEPR